MLYVNPEGERFVVMGPEEYEHLTGESAESLQTIDPARGSLLEELNNGNLNPTASHGVDSLDTLRNTNESPEESRGPASTGSHATELAALRLEEEIGVDDLPL